MRSTIARAHHHGSGRSLGARFLVFASAFVALLGLCAATAFGSPTTWTSEAPARGSVSTSVVGAVSAKASCPDGLAATARVLVDGKLVKSYVTNPPATTGRWALRSVWNDDWEQWEIVSVWVLDPDLTQAAILAYANASADGTHTAAFTIVSKLGVSSTDTWTFKVAIPPMTGSPTPAPGSLVTTTTPIIEIPASDNSVVASCIATVNGVASAATYSSLTGRVRVTPPKPLPNDATTTVTVSVFDGIGLRKDVTWSFFVQTFPDMASQVALCTACHVGFENDPDMGAGCSNCHGNGGGSIPHRYAPSSYHVNADVSQCRPCHQAELTVEHARWTTHSGVAITCMTCHQSQDSAVVGAIARSDSSCLTCHPALNHESSHVTAVSPACVGPACHSGASLTAIHINSRTALTCATCHQSSDPLVAAAVLGGSKDCIACHSATSPHGDLAPAHTATMGSGNVKVFSGGHGQLAGAKSVYAGCTLCHGDANLVTIHANDCTVCHLPGGATSSLTTWNRSCQQGACHPAIHLYVDAPHIAAANDDCNPCHENGWTNVTSDTCLDCHSAAPDTTPPITVLDWSPAGFVGGNASFVGTATIGFVATDNRGPSAVRYTYYRLDGTATQTVTGSLVVPQPASGFVYHTLVYWSVDWSSNVEAANTRTFRVAHKP